MSEKIFADGLRVEIPTKAPDFIKMRLSFHVKDFQAFLGDYQNERGWLNLDVKESKTGKLYAELNTYKKGDMAPQKPKPVSDEIEYPDEDINPDDIPF